MHRTLTMTLLLTSTMACGEKIDQAKQAAIAAKAMADAAQDMSEASKDIEKAGAAAAEQARAQGSDEKTVEMAKALGAMQAMNQAQGTGPVVNWRQLVPFVPEKVGAFASSGEVDGKTTKAGGMEVTVVKRRYKAGERDLTLSVSDISLSPMMRAPFQMAAMISEDSSDGYKKGKQIDGHTAIVEWNEKSKRSKAVVLVANRYIVDANVSDAAAHDESEQVVKSVDLNALAKVVAETAG